MWGIFVICHGIRAVARKSRSWSAHGRFPGAIENLASCIGVCVGLQWSCLCFVCARTIVPSTYWLCATTFHMTNVHSKDILYKRFPWGLYKRFPYGKSHNRDFHPCYYLLFIAQKCNIVFSMTDSLVKRIDRLVGSNRGDIAQGSCFLNVRFTSYATE